MGHTCPNCGQFCTCNGDIDDIDFGEDCPAADACSCPCQEEEAESDDYYDDDATDYPEPRTCTACGADLDPVDGCPNNCGLKDEDGEE